LGHVRHARSPTTIALPTVKVALRQELRWRQYRPLLVAVSFDYAAKALAIEHRAAGQGDCQPNIRVRMGNDRSCCHDPCSDDNGTGGSDGNPHKAWARSWRRRLMADLGQWRCNQPTGASQGRQRQQRQSQNTSARPVTIKFDRIVETANTIQTVKRYPPP
jgi:hypothetical protein